MQKFIPTYHGSQYLYHTLSLKINKINSFQESSSKRKKTPPGAASETERKKQLIRALGRKPSEERVSVYVRKSSVGDSVSPKNSPTEPENKTKQFMDSMAARNKHVG